MLWKWRALTVLTFVAVARAASAGDDPLAPPLAPTTIQLHQFSLEECLSLSDRNFPNLWAARARLAYVHAQLDEAKWTPWFQWSANGSFGVAPPLLGTVVFPQSSFNAVNIGSLSGLEPFLHFDISGVVPLYTFGKMENAVRAAEAGERVSEWDMERARQQMRMDVRRAWYGLQLARDAKYLVGDALARIDKGIEGVKGKIAKGNQNVGDVDRLRLESFRQDVTSQSLQAPKGEAYALAALRFMTGVETGFDVVDQPLKRPDRPLVSIAQYLEAARILRPDVNMARAGVVARRAMVDFNRGKLFPDFGLGLGASYYETPSAELQNNAWSNGDNYLNHFYWYATLGFKMEPGSLAASRAHPAGRGAAGGDARHRTARPRQCRVRGREGLRRRSRGQGP